MTYAANRLYCDADSHIMETRDWVAQFADPGVRVKPAFPKKPRTNSTAKIFRK